MNKPYKLFQLNYGDYQGGGFDTWQIVAEFSTAHEALAEATRRKRMLPTDQGTWTDYRVMMQVEQPQEPQVEATIH